MQNVVMEGGRQGRNAMEGGSPGGGGGQRRRVRCRGGEGRSSDGGRVAAAHRGRLGSSHPQFPPRPASRPEPARSPAPSAPPPAPPAPAVATAGVPRAADPRRSRRRSCSVAVTPARPDSTVAIHGGLVNEPTAAPEFAPSKDSRRRPRRSLAGPASRLLRLLLFLLPDPHARALEALR